MLTTVLSHDLQKMLLQLSKYLPQIAPEAVSEHEKLKCFRGHAPRPPFVDSWICHVKN